MPEQSIAANIGLLRSSIAEAALRSGRNPGEVLLIAVSKSAAAPAIREALAAKQFVFGESYMQEAAAKIEELRASSNPGEARFHFVGSLQRNKVRRAVGLFEMIHSVDRLELAAEISREAVRQGIAQKILIQINISGEESKSGIRPEKAKALCQEILLLPGIELCGLMCIGGFYEMDENRIRSEFRAMRNLRDELGSGLGRPLPELSMGMSGDYRLAVEEGSTMLRIGTAIFGARP